MSKSISNAALDRMIDAGIAAIDLYEIAKTDIILHAHLKEFLRAALGKKGCDR
jgi:hypothetical protein